MSGRLATEPLGVAVFYCQAIRKEVQAMAEYPLQELLSLWYREQVTVEQVIGQILQHLIALEKELGELKRQLSKPPPKEEK
jgi:hypothetical protein